MIIIIYDDHKKTKDETCVNPQKATKVEHEKDETRTNENKSAKNIKGWQRSSDCHRVVIDFSKVIGLSKVVGLSKVTKTSISTLVAPFLCSEQVSYSELEYATAIRTLRHRHIDQISEWRVFEQVQGISRCVYAWHNCLYAIKSFFRGVYCNAVTMHALQVACTQHA